MVNTSVFDCVMIQCRIIVWDLYNLQLVGFIILSEIYNTTIQYFHGPLVRLTSIQLKIYGHGWTASCKKFRLPALNSLKPNCMLFGWKWYKTLWNRCPDGCVLVTRQEVTIPSIKGSQNRVFCNCANTFSLFLHCIFSK